MTYFDSILRQFSSFSFKSEVAALPLQLEEGDSDIEALEKERAKAVDGRHHNISITKTASEQQLEYLLSNLLKYGVLIASAVVLFGGILYLLQHGSEPARYRIFQGEPSDFCSALGVLNAVKAGSSRGIIQLGLLLLVATPIVRVIISFFVFLRIKDFKYVIITMLVLMALIYSFFRAYY